MHNCYLKILLLFILFPIKLYGNEINSTSYHEIKCGPGWNIWHFDQPSILLNRGSKIVVGYVVNPTTNKWEPVIQNPWIGNYLDFGYKGDNIYVKLKILKPITIAFVGFKGGSLDLQVTAMPTIRTTQKSPPLMVQP
jgi:hypothetical protein